MTSSTGLVEPESEARHPHLEPDSKKKKKKGKTWEGLGRWEMAESVTPLPHKREDLSSIPALTENPGMVGRAQNPSAETGGS